MGITLASSLILSQGMGIADAAEKETQPIKKEKVSKVDKDKNGIPDSWQKNTS